MPTPADTEHAEGLPVVRSGQETAVRPVGDCEPNRTTTAGAGTRKSKSNGLSEPIADPYHQERDPNDGRMLYFGKVPEVGHWLRVVVENHQLHTAYLDRRLEDRWGKP